MKEANRVVKRVVICAAAYFLIAAAIDPFVPPGLMDVLFFTGIIPLALAATVFFVATFGLWREKDGWSNFWKSMKPTRPKIRLAYVLLFLVALAIYLSSPFWL